MPTLKASSPPKRTKVGVKRPCTNAEVQAVLRVTDAKLIKFKAGANVFRQGDPAEWVYFISQGKVQISVLSKQGKEGVIGLLTEGDFVGQISLTAQKLFLSSADAVTACEITKIRRDTMRELLQNNDVIAEVFTAYLLQNGVDVEAELVDHLFNSSEKRLARVLLLLANFGHEGRLEPILDMTQEQLARRVGTTRARISHFMNKFRSLGLIDYNGSIKVHSGLLNVVLHDARLGSDK
jgi:CRP/FNR family cyclic AMP-dependent transcriptional regulator